MRIEDSDTGESSMDVVPVPEGLSVQIGLKGQLEYLSVIVSPTDEERLFTFLHRRQAKNN